jgi:hypothetical protein
MMDTLTRYRNDAVFHAIVDMFYNYLCTQKDWGISDLRDAVLCAAMKWEMENFHPIPVAVSNWFQGIEGEKDD